MQWSRAFSLVCGSGPESWSLVKGVDRYDEQEARTCHPISQSSSIHPGVTMQSSSRSRRLLHSLANGHAVSSHDSTIALAIRNSPRQRKNSRQGNCAPPPRTGHHPNSAFASAFGAGVRIRCRSVPWFVEERWWKLGFSSSEGSCEPARNLGCACPCEEGLRAWGGTATVVRDSAGLHASLWR